jgi:hypothetical protein
MEFEDIQSDAEYEDQKEVEGQADDDELQIIDGPKEIEGEVAERNKSQVDPEQVDVVERNRPQVRAVERNRSQASASKANRKNSPKKKSADGIVGVMERFVQIKEKEAKQEVTQDFTITRCMEALKTLEGVTPDEKMTASEVFNSAHNREFFLSLVGDKDGTAIAWFRRQIARLT